MPPASGKLVIPGALAGVAERNADGTVKRPSAEESAAKLEVVGAGLGGIVEMARWMSDDQVMWGLVRFEVGSGSFARTKVLFLHFNGDSTPALRRGMANELTKEVNWFLRGGEDRDNFHASIEVKTVQDMTAEHILKIVSEFFVIDHVEGYDASWATKMYEEQLAREQAAQQAREAEAAALRERALEEARQAEEEARAQAEAAAAAAAEAAKSQLRYTVGRDALQSVAEHGAWNWLLLGPDDKQLTVLGGGDGSVEEMRECAEKHCDLVCFGMLRLPFGEGRLRRTKWAFVHLIGGRVSAVKRGKFNEKRPAMEDLCKGFANVTVSMYDVAAEDLSLESVIDRVRQVSVVDEQVLEGDETSKNIFSMEAFRAALKKEQEELQAAERAAEPPEEAPAEEAPPPEPEPPAEPEPERPPNADLAITDILRLVRHERACNWALFRPRAKKGGAKATPNLFHQHDSEGSAPRVHTNAARREKVVEEVGVAPTVPKVQAQGDIAEAKARLKAMKSMEVPEAWGTVKPIEPTGAEVRPQLLDDVEHLIDSINRLGEREASGVKTVTFGKVVRCPALEQHLDSLVDALKAARALGYINYQGPMAHKGAHDAKIITLHKDKVTD